MGRLFSMILSVAMLVVVAQGQAKAAGDGRDPEVVPRVNIKRYAGMWMEIAHNPNFFQDGCLRSTAEYKVLSPVQVSVHNVCYEDGGSISDISGTATVVDPAVPAKLLVEFNIFAKGDYWITDLDPNYQWAVVSGPAKKSVFILARKAPMDKKLLKSILKRMASKGFDTKELIFDQY